MKVIILGGFLGAGKTTVLLQLAKYLSSKTNSPNKISVAIIENEIGSIGIDDKTITKSGYNVQNLFSGCICCSIAGELMQTVASIRNQFAPQWLIIESTGMAYPDKIKLNLEQELVIDAMTIVIFDAYRFKGLSKTLGSIFLGQLKDASYVFINKVDLVNEEQINEAKDTISKYNAEAKIFRISAKNPLPFSLWNELF